MKQVYLDIHKAIHNLKQKKVVINTQPVEIQTNKQNNCRFVVFKDSDGKEYEIIQQNPNTQSSYAQRARDGEKISWVIPYYFGVRKSDGWKVITDSTTLDKIS